MSKDNQRRNIEGIEKALSHLIGRIESEVRIAQNADDFFRSRFSDANDPDAQVASYLTGTSEITSPQYYAQWTERIETTAALLETAGASEQAEEIRRFRPEIFDVDAPIPLFDIEGLTGCIEAIRSEFTRGKFDVEESSHKPHPDGSSAKGFHPKHRALVEPLVDEVTDHPTQPLEAKRILLGWREILDALGRPQGDKRKIENLNKKFGGPIASFGQGAGPRVAAETLFNWWNNLASEYEQKEENRAGRQRDADASTRDRYLHGRSAEVVPEIGGHSSGKRR